MGLRWHLRASVALERQEFRWRAEGLASQTGMLGAAWSAVGLSAVDGVSQTGCALALPGLRLLMLALCVGLGGGLCTFSTLFLIALRGFTLRGHFPVRVDLGAGF